MLRWLRWILIGTALSAVWVFFSEMAYTDLPVVTYEQIVSGEYKGQTVKVRAKPYVTSWAVQMDNGNYQTDILEDALAWGIYSNDFNKASKACQEVLNEIGSRRNNQVMVLEVELRRNGSYEIKSISMPDEFAITEHQERVITWGGVIIIASVIFLILIIPCLPVGYKKQPPQPIRTRIIGNYTEMRHPGAAARAIVGGLIGGWGGAAIGAGTTRPRYTHLTRFVVWYDNGKQKVETVSEGNYLYKKYIELLDAE